jgi:hypothetical protein
MRTVRLSAVSIVAAGLLLATIGVTAAGTAAKHKETAIVHFTNPTLVAGQVLPEGEYLIAHDDDMMARGGPCTTIFCFDVQKGWTEVVSFHCRPVAREKAGRTTLDMVVTTAEERANGGAVDKLIEYQFAGDTEGHGVPEARVTRGESSHPARTPGWTR